MYSSQVDALKLAVVAAMLDLLNLYEAAETVPGNSSLVQVLGECATALIRYFFFKKCEHNVVFAPKFAFFFCFLFSFGGSITYATFLASIWHGRAVMSHMETLVIGCLVLGSRQALYFSKVRFLVCCFVLSLYCLVHIIDLIPCCHGQIGAATVVVKDTPDLMKLRALHACLDSVLQSKYVCGGMCHGAWC
jgi:hypothetical protein